MPTPLFALSTPIPKLRPTTTNFDAQQHHRVRLAPLHLRASLSTLSPPACTKQIQPQAPSTHAKNLRRIARVTAGSLALVVALLRAGAVLANPVTTTTAVASTAESFISGVTASLALVLASEIGDKTFFISALLSMRYSRALVLIGTMAALGSMTVISVALGQLAHAVPNTLRIGLPLDDYAAVILLVYFGIQNIRDGLSMRADESDELDGAMEVVGPNRDGTATVEIKSPFRIVSETCSVVFFAEWGDKSMLATVALAAAKNPLGVIVGGVTGHFIATIIAVIGGSLLGKYISERNARLVGGVLFLVFAALTLRGVW